uniref:Potassium channel tetramerization domain containing 11 n=1 Tax=Salarias fasciatus TaxID=181472 RepID=A0A672GB53_SALFA
MLDLNPPDDSGDGTPVRDPVSLNVGGQVYTTTLDTLTRYRDSMLGAMFTGQIPALRDRRGNVFIDRDGNVFRHILNFLRSGALDLPRGFKELALLRREADFFQIRPLVEELAHLEAAGPLITFHVEIDVPVRLLHYNLRHGPENYELRTCSVRAFAVDLFCTWRAFLALLCERFCYRTSQGAARPHPCDPGGSRLRLEWAPRPDQLPQDQYDKQRYRGLAVRDAEAAAADDVPPGPRPVGDMQSFLEELLKVSLAEGFRVDLASPDPADVLHCASLRLVKG